VQEEDNLGWNDHNLEIGYLTLMATMEQSVVIPSWTLTTTIVDFPMMSFQPPSPTSASSLPPGHPDSSSLALDFGHWSRDEIAALLDGMGFDDKEEPLPSTLTS
jgi:hypothetical protein